jgi:pimeloyl-ACP methyl ester carboxylesterase
MDRKIPIGKETLFGQLSVPADAIGLVLFAHGSGSSRLSPRNQFVARHLEKRKIATLLFDLLTEEEEKIDEFTAELRFDIPFLAKRLLATTAWAKTESNLPIGYFGASTGAAAALAAAAKKKSEIRAVVSRGGRPDLAGSALANVVSPTLLIVGSFDSEVIALNREAFAALQCEKKLEIVPGASHLFEEPGTLEAAARLAAEWFAAHFSSHRRKK